MLYRLTGFPPPKKHVFCTSGPGEYNTQKSRPTQLKTVQCREKSKRIKFTSQFSRKTSKNVIFRKFKFCVQIWQHNDFYIENSHSAPKFTPKTLRKNKKSNAENISDQNIPNLQNIISHRIFHEIAWNKNVSILIFRRDYDFYMQKQFCSARIYTFVKNKKCQTISNFIFRRRAAAPGTRNYLMTNCYDRICKFEKTRNLYFRLRRNQKLIN